MALTDNLISFWELEEVSGTRLDSHSTNDLDDNNTVTQQTGKVGNCGQFTRANTEYLSIPDSDGAPIDLRGGSAFSIVAWVYFDTFAGGEVSPIVTKDDINGSEYAIRAAGSFSENTFRAFITQALTGEVHVDASTFGAPSTGTWYMVAVTCVLGDALKISVNAGPQDSLNINSNALLVGGGATKATFQIGAWTQESWYHNGRIDQVGFWSRELTTAEITELYNSGNGLSYADLVGGGQQVFNQSINATEVSSVVLNRLLAGSRTFNAQEMGSSALVRLLLASRAMAVNLIESVNINRLTGKSISATANAISSIIRRVGKNINGNYQGQSALSRVLSVFRPLSAINIGAVVLNAVSTTAQLFLQTIAVNAEFNATLTKGIVRSLSVQIVSVAILGRILTGARTVNVGQIGTAILSWPLTALRTLHASHVGTIMLDLISNVAQLFVRTITATAQFAPTFNRRLASFRTLSAQAFLFTAILRELGRSIPTVCVAQATILRSIGKSIAASIIGNPILLRFCEASRTFVAGSVGSAILDIFTTVAQVFLRTFAATVELTPIINRRVDALRTTSIRAILTASLNASGLLALGAVYLEQGISEIKDRVSRVSGVQDLTKRVHNMVDYVGRVTGIKGHKR